MTSARDRLATRHRSFERYLRSALSRAPRFPNPLGSAVRYAALSPGKRIRPLLALASCEAVGGDWRSALPAAAAIECVHAFSLVHDDLPAMDDDDYRRGRLTTHKKFGEALGILVGDALLALAFEELTRLERTGVPPRRVVEAVRRLARAAGGAELVAGQALDIAAERRRSSPAAVRRIHRHKTGALLGCSLALGAIAGGARPNQVSALERVGVELGLVFQVQDDLLNAGSTLSRLGKRAGTDRARGKATYVRAAGESAARAAVERGLRRVIAAIERQCRHPQPVLEVVARVAARTR